MRRAPGPRVDPRRARGHRILDQSALEAAPRRRPPRPALERLHAALTLRHTTQRRAAQALGVSRAELWEWLFGWRWQPTDATVRALHAYLDGLERAAYGCRQ